MKIEEGEDPPDLYLVDKEIRIPVEVTRLPRFSIRPNGKLANRMTENSLVLGIIKSLNEEISSNLPLSIQVNLTVYAPISRPYRFKNRLRNVILQTDWSKHVGLKKTVSVNEIEVILSIHSTDGGPSKIVGIVPNRNMSADIALNARLSLSDSIKRKVAKCANIEQKIWLGILDDESYLTDFANFERAAREVKIDHDFDRILMISSGGVVEELFI